MDQMFSAIILKRARTYYEGNLVNIEAITFGEIVGRAEGNREYHLTLKREDSQVRMSCDCPYEGPCKHLAAFLRLLADEPDEELLLFTNEATEDYFQGYLKTLNKTELVNLVQTVRHTGIQNRDSADRCQPPATGCRLYTCREKI